MRTDIKITLATVCFNAEQTIERTLESIAMQTYSNIEHLIIDGQSRDRTLDLAGHYAQRCADHHEVVIVSEPDKGLYDAMNKALRRATGHYIVFMNAGDRLHSPDTIEQLVATIPDGPLPGVLYGETDIVDSESHFLSHRRLQAPERLTWRSFLNGMLVCHQSFYASTALARTTPYNLSYRFSADVDWCIRIMKEAASQGLALHHSHLVLTDYLSEGMTTANHRASLRERFRVMSAHYGLIRTTLQHAWFVIRAVR